MLLKEGIVRRKKKCIHKLRTVETDFLECNNNVIKQIQYLQI